MKSEGTRVGVETRFLMSFLLAATITGCAPRYGEDIAARPAPAAAPLASKKAADDLDKPICRHERSVGSNIPRKVCTTKREIEEQRRYFEEIQHRPGIQTMPGG